MPGISKTVVSLQPGITIIGLYESSQNARDASDRVQKIFSDMAPFVASPPERGVYSGVWFPAK